MLRLALLIPLAGVWLMVATPADASCIHWSDEELFERAEIIFKGSVTKVELFNPWDGGGSSGITAKLRVQTVWKGVPAPSITVTTPSNVDSGGLGFEEGENYLIYAMPDSFYPSRAASYCEGSGLIGGGGMGLNALGIGIPYPFPSIVGILASFMLACMLRLAWKKRRTEA